MAGAANDDVCSTEALAVSNADLLSYVDNQLSAAGRARIEGFLACNPDLAAKVMRELHKRARTPNPASRTATSGRITSRTVRLLATCLACGIAGWAVAEGLDSDGPFRDLSSIPEYVEDAIMSQRVAHVRIGMVSQIETTQLDTAEIQLATQIRMPTLPHSWRLVDAQIYPSEEGPSVSVLIETASGQKINLFAVRADTSATATPVVTERRGAQAAYWELEGAAYVLTGDVSRSDLLTQASLLSQSALM